MNGPTVDCPAMSTKKHAATTVPVTSGSPPGRRWEAKAPTNEVGGPTPPHTVSVSHWWNSPTNSAGSSCLSGVCLPQNGSSAASFQRIKVAGATPQTPRSSISTRQGSTCAKEPNRSSRSSRSSGARVPSVAGQPPGGPAVPPSDGNASSAGEVTAGSQHAEARPVSLRAVSLDHLFRVPGGRAVPSFTPVLFGGRRSPREADDQTTRVLTARGGPRRGVAARGAGRRCPVRS